MSNTKHIEIPVAGLPEPIEVWSLRDLAAVPAGILSRADRDDLRESFLVARILSARLVPVEHPEEPDEPPTALERAAVLHRAGIPLHVRAMLGAHHVARPEDELPGGGAYRDLWIAARVLLHEAVRQDRRWTARVKLLEARNEHAARVLTGEVEL